MKPRHPIEFAAFTFLLVVFNLPGWIDPSLAALFPSALYGGEIWRWFTFPWAHLSLYHLALDATAFLCLYDLLRGGARARMVHLLSCIFFSGLIPVLAEPRLSSIGLRGLSGVAHGMALVAGLECLASGSRGERGLGLLAAGCVIGKCLIEQLTGGVFFANYHLGNVGLPVPSCHVGGALGGLFSSWLLRRAPRENDRTDRRKDVNLPHVAGSVA